MSGRRSITINGDLGSGKSTVAIEIAQRLGRRRVSMGDVYRQMAEDRGMTALQLNRHSERDENIDAYVDKIQIDMADSGEPMVVDSRLGWHFFANAFKVYLITEPTVAAQRVLSRPADGVESYSSNEEAERHLRERSESERVRFIAKYGVDKSRLRNYSLVCDTTSVSPEEAIDRIIAAFNESLQEDLQEEEMAPLGPSLLLYPSRVYPAEQIQTLRGMWDSEGARFVSAVGSAGMDVLDPIDVGYNGTDFFVVDGHRRLSAAIQCGFKLIRARLVAEADEPTVGGLTAAEFFESGVQLATVHDWEAVHNIRLPLPPHLLQHS
jgi:cytidylate kinase